MAHAPRLRHLWPLAGAALLLLAGYAPAQRLPRDPVEALRRALLEAPEARTRPLRETAKGLRGLGDLGRAMFLNEWEVRFLGEEEEKTRLGLREELAERFKEEAREALRRGDTEQRQAALTFLRQMGMSARSAGFGSPFVQRQLSDLAPAVAAVADAPDPRVREEVARALSYLGASPEAAARAFGALLKDPAAPVRRAAAEGVQTVLAEYAPLELRRGGDGLGLGGAGPGVGFPEAGGQPGVPPPMPKPPAGTNDMARALLPLAGGALDSPDPVVRRTLAGALQATSQFLADRATVVGSPQRFPDLPGGGDRKGLLAGLGMSAEELQPLARALADQVPALSRAARDAVPEVRRRAVRALEYLADARRFMLLRRALAPRGGAGEEQEQDAPRQEQGKPAVDPLGAALQGASPALAAALSDPDPQVRLAAVEALEMLGNDARPVAEALTGALADHNAFVRWAAARATGRMQPAAAAPVFLPGLVRLLRDPDLDVRLAAVTALIAYGPEAAPAVAELTAVLDCGDPEFRVGVLFALEAIGVEALPALPAITAALAERDFRVRTAAAEVLGRFARLRPLPPGTEAALRRALDDPEPSVRRAASEALLVRPE